ASPGVPRLVGREAAGVLAALTGVALAADPVHRDRERLVGFAGEGAQRHRAGGEALHDLALRLHLLDRDRRALEVEEPAQGRQPRVFGVEVVGVLAERLEAA